MDLEEDDGPEESRGRIPREVEFLWDTDNEQPPRGTPSSAHRAAIELLRHAHEEQVDVSRLQGRTLQDMRHLLEDQSMELDSFKCKMGRINELASQHGLVAEAIEKALAGEEATDLTALSDKIDLFRQALDNDAVAETETSKTIFLLQLMMKVRKNGSHCLDLLTRRVNGMARPCQSVGQCTHPQVSSMSLLPGVTADTSFGKIQIGGVEVDLTINAMFGLIRSLEGKVQIISDRAKRSRPYGFGFIRHTACQLQRSHCGSSLRLLW